MKSPQKNFASPTQITGHFLKKLGERYDPPMEKDIEDRC